MRQIIYLHGFNSAPQSLKARQLGAFLAARGEEGRLHVPALAPDPARAIAEVMELAGRLGEVAFIGSSLGGFYAAWLGDRFAVPAVLINPAMRPHALLAPYLGPQQNLYTGETYVLEAAMLETLAQLDLAVVREPSRVLLLAQTGDEVLDWREAAAKFRDSPQLIQEGGNHAFQHFESYLPQILQFVDTA